MNNLCFSFISVICPKSTQPWDQKKCFMRAVLLQQMSVGGDSVSIQVVCMHSKQFDWILKCCWLFRHSKWPELSIKEIWGSNCDFMIVSEYLSCLLEFVSTIWPSINTALVIFPTQHNIMPESNTSLLIHIGTPSPFSF